MLEVEAKLRVADPSLVRARLQAAGARPLGAHEQHDTFFAHPQRDFAATDEALRLRRQDVGPPGGLDSHGGPGGRGRLELTYKGPRLAAGAGGTGGAGAAKARVEHTLALDEDPGALLGALGFRPAAQLAKRREAYAVGEATVALDHLAGLGWFVEVEAVGPDRDAAERVVERALGLLGLGGEPRVRESYLELWLRRGGTSPARGP